jgi:hypothetical protein
MNPFAPLAVHTAFSFPGDQINIVHGFSSSLWFSGTRCFLFQGWRGKSQQQYAARLSYTDMTVVRNLQLMLSFATSFRKLLVIALAPFIFKFILCTWSPFAMLGAELVYLGFTFLECYWIRESRAGAAFTTEDRAYLVGGMDVKLIEEPEQRPVLVFLARAASVGP